jgi:hypothetical protein
LKETIDDFPKPLRILQMTFWDRLTFPKEFCNCLEAKTGSGDILSQKLTDIKMFKILLESNPCFLVFDNHSLYDTAMDQDRSLSRHGMTGKIWSNFSLKQLIQRR